AEQARHQQPDCGDNLPLILRPGLGYRRLAGGREGAPRCQGGLTHEATSSRRGVLLQAIVGAAPRSRRGASPRIVASDSRDGGVSVFWVRLRGAILADRTRCQGGRDS